MSSSTSSWPRSSRRASSSSSAARLWVSDADPHQEAVQLRLRQRVGALVLDRVLRREDQEWALQLPRAVLARDLTLLHRLQQRRLRLRRRAIDLVAEQHVREDRPGLEAEIADSLVIDRRPGHVRRHEVGRELHAGESKAGHRGERTGDQRLGEARVVLDQHVPVRQQPEEDELERVALAHDGPLHLVQDPGGAVPELGGGGEAQSASRLSSTASSSRGATPAGAAVRRLRTVRTNELPRLGPQQPSRLVVVAAQLYAPPGETRLCDLRQQGPQLGVCRQAALARPFDDPLDSEQLTRERRARWSSPWRRRALRDGQPSRELGDADHRRDHADRDDDRLERHRLQLARRARTIARRYPSGRRGASRLATAMRVSHVRAAAAVIVLTALVCVVAAAGDEPIRERPEPLRAEPQRAHRDRRDHLRLSDSGPAASGGVPPRGVRPRPAGAAGLAMVAARSDRRRRGRMGRSADRPRAHAHPLARAAPRPLAMALAPACPDSAGRVARDRAGSGGARRGCGRPRGGRRGARSAARTGRSPRRRDRGVRTDGARARQAGARPADRRGATRVPPSASCAITACRRSRSRR